MAYLNHEEAFEDFKSNALEGIRKHFPVEGRDKTLVLRDLQVQMEKADADDIEAQHKAKVSGETFSRPIVGTFALVDKKTGKEVVQKVKLGELPMLTRRYSYIVGGQEYQVDNQWQLKPGVYTKRRESGELETRFNTANKPSLDVTFDPNTKLFLAERRKSKSIPVYPIMRAMGVDDETLERQWGKDILEANKQARGSNTALERFYKADRKTAAISRDAAEKYVRETLLSSEVHPDATELTLGKPFSRIEGDTLVRATSKMLRVQQGEPEDNRDSLVFKDLRSIGDYAHDKLTEWKTVSGLRNKMQRQINNATNPVDIVRSSLFSQPLMATFKKNAAVRTADQVNPAEMVASSMATTVMGPGGIQSAHAILPETKYIDSSHFGFLDALHTPEGEKTGVTLHLPMGAKKFGRDVKIPVYNLKTGKREYITPKDFVQSPVVLPDQVTWRDGKPVANSAKVRVSAKGNEFDEMPLSQAKYTMYHPSQTFSLTSNLIPFMGNTSGNRASYATHHIEQAISLTEREAPLIQVSTGSNKQGARSFEDFIGRQTGHLSPADGTVVDVTKKAVTIKDSSGKKHVVQLYDNFPLNDAKSVLTSYARVKTGDKVNAGQHVADNNFTQNGTLALGKNLTVAYIPYKGYNFEDGVVISESGARALRSEHLYKPNVALQPTDVTAPNKFQIQHPEAFKKDQYEKLDDDGVVKVGQRIMPGDPLVLAARPTLINDRAGIARIRKSLAGQHSDSSLRWDGEHAGEVVGVHRNKEGEVTVHVRTVEPMQVGDKLSGRYGNKGIVTAVLPDDEMPRTKGGEVIQVALNPAGIPGRMNVGQVLETALSKVAKKTGVPYVLDNFEHGVDQVERAKQELKKHGLDDQEELIDPRTGMSLGKALVGYQHMLKLRHQVDKKVSVRSGMTLRGETPETYDVNLMPTSGGKSGGQSFGNLGLNVMLAHNAKANIREAHTWKSEGPDPSPEAKKWPSQHHEVWNAIQLGEPLPTPKPTFAFRKFTDMLRASGINVEKKGHKLQLSPLTDQEVLSTSSGQLAQPGYLTYSKVDKDGNLKPRPGGLFDERMTGGIGGKKWSHMKLAEPMPNPVFEGPIQKLLGISSKQYTQIINGELGMSPTGTIIAAGKGSTGGGAIVEALKHIDVGKALAAAHAELDKAKAPSSIAHGASTQKLDAALKKVKYLTLLKSKGARPHEAYAVNYLPILPPAMRPPSIMADGNVRWEDVNGLYSQIGQVNGQLSDLRAKSHLGIGDAELKKPRASLYDGLRALTGIGQASSPMEKEKKGKGYMQLISGNTPKEGYFQKTLLSRRQDMTMRSTIVPEPAMGLDDVGVPEEKALGLFRPFVINKMVHLGVAPNALEAQEMLKNKGAIKSKGIQQALDLVMAERPVLMKRDPALHKHSIQAFNAHRTKGSAIKIHPLVVSGYNADFDGDSVDLDTPIILRLRGEVCMATGRTLEKLFNPGPGDYVLNLRDTETLTYSGWSKVTALSFHIVENKRKFRVTLKNGISFIVSEDHSLMRGREKIQPKQLQLDMELDHETVPCSSGGRSYENGVILGHFLGDGSVDECRVSIACKPEQEQRYLIDLWKQEYGCHVSESKHGYFQISRKHIAADIFRLCGRYCDGKYVSYELLNGGAEFLKGLLAGYILSDGSVELTKSGSFLVRTWSRSKRLRDEMSLAANMLGLPHSIRERVAKGKTNYIISFGKESIKLLDYRCPGKKGDLIRHARDEYETNRQDDRRSQSARGYEVQAVEEVEYDERMVDLSVEGDHVFAIQGGVILHNTMSLYVPISHEAVTEARNMMPTKNLFNEATGRVTYVPTLESALGLYKLTTTHGTGKKQFNSVADAMKAVQAGTHKIDELAQVKGYGKTTPGRILVSEAVPAEFRKRVLEDHKFVLDKGGVAELYGSIAKKNPNDFSDASNKLKDLGFDASYGHIRLKHPEKHVGPGAIVAAEVPKTVQLLAIGTHSLSLNDLTPDKRVRDRIIKETETQLSHLPHGLTKTQREARTVELWEAATKRMKEEHKATAMKKPDNLIKMLAAGTKPSWDQYQQLKLAPMLLEDASGRTIPTPVTKSYSEGLDMAGYWIQSSGARKGSIQKVQEVQDPGYFSKQLVNTAMNLVVNGNDCGTTRGIGLPIADRDGKINRDVYDRELAADLTVRGNTFRKGTILSPDVVGQIRKFDKNAQLVVRSTLKCEHGTGLCQHCAGISPSGTYYDKGTNIGLLGAQSLGERSVQLSLKAFHSGGVKAVGGKGALGAFDRTKQLTLLPKRIPDSAALAMRSGKIERIEDEKLGTALWIDGERHFIQKDRAGRSLVRPVGTVEGWKAPKVGMTVEAGQLLSDPTRSFINPHDLYKATNNIEKVQNFLTNELHSIYKEEGVRRQHIETVVKGMSNLTRVRAPGDSEGILKGEYQALSQVRAMNAELQRQGKAPIQHSPIVKGIDVMPQVMQEDWMAKLNYNRLTKTITDAAAEGAVSDLHGLHPMPGAAYGAEFGMTSKDKFKAPHLANVPDWKY